MSLRTGALALLACGTLVGCAESPPPTRSIELVGTISPPPGATTYGTVHVTVFHAWELEGELRHPRGEIESFETQAGAYRHALAYPVGTGEGLLVYAWQDADGDGVHCTPSAREELAGLAVVKDFPADRAVADVDLTQPCRGPDWFYP